MIVQLACGVIFGPTISVVSHWFKKRRSTAMGIVACGSSIGGTVFPIAFRNLVDVVGFPWTMRILGFMLLALLAMPNLVRAVSASSSVFKITHSGFCRPSAAASRRRAPKAASSTSSPSSAPRSSSTPSPPSSVSWASTPVRTPRSDLVLTIPPDPLRPQC
jgi:MFS family permease